MRVADLTNPELEVMDLVVAGFAFAILLVGCFSSVPWPNNRVEKTSSSPEQASSELGTVVQSNDEKAMPIPLDHMANSWYFDTGKKEVFYRRIGRKDYRLFGFCQELVAAEKEYRRTQHDEYAKAILSDKGQHNGLYWQAAAGEPPQPHRAAGGFRCR